MLTFPEYLIPLFNGGVYIITFLFTDFANVQPSVSFVKDLGLDGFGMDGFHL